MKPNNSYVSMPITPANGSERAVNPSGNSSERELVLNRMVRMVDVAVDEAAAAVQAMEDRHRVQAANAISNLHDHTARVAARSYDMSHLQPSYPQQPMTLTSKPAQMPLQGADQYSAPLAFKQDGPIQGPHNQIAEQFTPIQSPQQTPSTEVIPLSPTPALQQPDGAVNTDALLQQIYRLHDEKQRMGNAA